MRRSPLRSSEGVEMTNDRDEPEEVYVDKVCTCSGEHEEKGNDQKESKSKG